MNTEEVRVPRGYRRRKSVIDLNAVPGDQEGTSASSVRALTVPAVATHSVPAVASHSVPAVASQPVPTPIDVDAIEDDVIESSASAFAEAKSKSRNARRRSLMVDVESGGTTRLPANTSNKRRRIPSNEPVIDCEHGSVVEVDMLSRLTRSKAPAPPPEEPKFTCPICMCPFTEEMSTKCGHIFCKGCIKMAISRQGKCPTCRKKVTAKELIRVFLPATR
ncbi:hypothetical protein CARUB_v10027099mg [Capsella rubella]|uniref:RING-type domain-containing protein n=1 Tax=Capsella rubella TaxID=81985 RepID=R0GN53_9BRAS|nr:LON peptidase N-terminal domain and RING finger protein 3 [Capsella rubella]XP_023638350.1 LON peptidase N-terminal domain and RING finger protein 3 [Capsella rubella]EOA12593.1 hypothetical protein CARUB_v10027099mg [Capsella rubella]